MKRTLLFITLLLIFVTDIFAIARTSNEAFSIANSFYQKTQSSIKRMSLESTTLKLAYTCTDNIATRSSSEYAYYYVFNIGNNSGFIIVSGDDRAKEVLGYSISGTFNSSSLPPNFSAWLGFYKKEMKVLMEQPETAIVASTIQLSTSNDADSRQATFATSVAPLLGGIKWDQDAPYNNLCPIIDTQTSERAAAGCVATAMAQVMRYYKWPVSGTGSHSYTPGGSTTPLTANFSQTVYDWANMSETYNSSSTDAQNLAVATLVYHAGVSVDMDYDISSGAATLDMAKALINYFSYDSNIQCYQRDFYSNTEWLDMIKTELNAQRPVLYAGNSSDAGHQFVCDGYDSNGLFHFNWGWSGTSDGYFELSVLNPSALGIGGGTSGGFNTDQSIVIGVQKPNASSTIPPYQLDLYTLTTAASSIGRTSSFTLSMRFFNMGTNTFGGSVGIALYNNNGFVKLINSHYVSSLGTLSGYINPNYAKYISIPSDVDAGNYKLYSVFQSSGESNWQIMRGKVGVPNYLNVVVTSSNVTLSTPDVFPKLTLNSMSATGNLYQNRTSRLNLNITNAGEEYNSNIVIQLKSVNDTTYSQMICNDPINIPSGETKSFELVGNISLLAGQYYLIAYYDSQNDRSNSSYSSFANRLIVDVLAEPTETPALVLTSKISFPNATKVNKKDAVLTTHIKNTGGYFENNLIAFVYLPTGGNSLTYLGYQKVIFDKNEEKTITFTGNIDLDSDSYLIAVYYWDTAISDWSQITPNEYSLLAFTLVDDATGVEKTTLNKLHLYPALAKDVLYLQSDDVVKIISIIDLSGKQILLMRPDKNGEIPIPVEGFSKGTYILQMESVTGIKVGKFIKR